MGDWWNGMVGYDLYARATPNWVARPGVFPTASNNSASLFLGLFTCLLTGQTFSTSSSAGRSNVAGSTSTSPNHVGQSCGSMITGIRSCSSPSPIGLFTTHTTRDNVWSTKANAIVLP